TWYIRRHSIKWLARLDGEEADGTFALVFGWIEPFNLRRAQGPSERLKGINNCTILDLNFLLGIPREDCGGDEADEHDPREVSHYRPPRVKRLREASMEPRSLEPGSQVKRVA